MADNRALRRRALKLHHLGNDLGDLLVAAGKCYSNGIDEAHTGKLDHVRRHLLEIEIKCELGQYLAQLLSRKRCGLVCPFLSGRAVKAQEGERTRAFEKVAPL